MSKNVALLVLNRGAKPYPEGSKLEKEATAEEGKHKEQRRKRFSPSLVEEALKCNHTAKAARILLKREETMKSLSLIRGSKFA